MDVIALLFVHPTRENCTGRSQLSATDCVLVDDSIGNPFILFICLGELFRTQASFTLGLIFTRQIFGIIKGLNIECLEQFTLLISDCG